MFPRCTRLIVLAIVGCWMPALSPLRAEAGDPGEIYLRGYSLKNEGEKLEAAGKLPEALNAYQQAQTIITSVAQNSPTWQPEVVQYRLQALQQTIARLSLRLPAGTPSNVATSPVPAGPLGSAPVGALPSTVPSLPTGPATPLDPIRAIQQEMARKDEAIKDLESRLKTYADAYVGATQARQKAEVDLGVLQRQMDTLKQKMDQMSKGVDATSEATVKELNRMKAEAAAVQDMIKTKDNTLAEAKKQAEAATKASEALKKEKDDLSNKVATLTTENKDLRTRLEAMPKGEKSEDLTRLMTENTRLKKELDDTRKQVEELKTSAGQKDTQIAQLKTQLTTIQGELVKLQSENTGYQQQVADLTVKLKEMGSNLAGSKDGKTGEQPPKLAEENKMLRTIIMRQLRQQERQRQAKELVIAEMKKMKSASQSLMSNLEEMTSAKIMLTMDEESLFSAPELKEIMSANGVRATLTAASSKTNYGKNNLSVPVTSSGQAAERTTATTTTEAKLLEAAQAAVEKGDLKAAEAAYQDALRANPKNVAARADLAGLKLQAKAYNAAEVELKKCLVYEPDNDVALYRLGVCYFQQGRMGDARIEFEKSIGHSPSNARAHHYLGIIENKQGRRELAETEFKKALAIDPDYGDAHFNLAVLYATSDPPKWDLAKQHYQDALSRGIKADPALEKLLNQPQEPKKEGAAVSSN